MQQYHNIRSENHLRPPHQCQLQLVSSSVLCSMIQCTGYCFQRKLYTKTGEVPAELDGVLDSETFEAARVYQLDKSRFAMWSDIYSQLEMTVSNCQQMCISDLYTWLHIKRWLMISLVFYQDSNQSRNLVIELYMKNHTQLLNISKNIV